MRYIHYQLEKFRSEQPMSERKIEPVQLGDETIYIEVTDIEQGLPKGQSGLRSYENTSADDQLTDAGERIRATISALAATVRSALDIAKPAEWTLEINIGFKGKAGIPFITEGEANGAVKVSAKWKRD